MSRVGERGSAETGLTVVGLLLAIIFLIYIGSCMRRDAEDRQANARPARGVVVGKHFAPAGVSPAPLYFQCGEGMMCPADLVAEPQDRWLLAVQATEGAKGTRAIEVPQSLYYRLQIGEAVPLRIMRGGLHDATKYVVEIDEAALPAPTPFPTAPPAAALPYDPRPERTNAKGQLRD